MGVITTASPPRVCQKFHRASELVGRRWTGAIIYVLLRARCRFATLREAIPDITDRMLSERLQELEHEGIVDRTVIPDTPVRVEYALTNKGRELVGTFDALSRWADRWVVPEAGSEVGANEVATVRATRRTARTTRIRRSSTKKKSSSPHEREER